MQPDPVDTLDDPPPHASRRAPDGASRRAALREVLVPSRLGVLGFHARLLACLTTLIATGEVAGTAASVRRTARAGSEPLATLCGSLAVGVGLVAMAAIVLFSIARLHDLGRRGWWLMLNAVPVLNVPWTLYVWLAPGSAASNRFGAAPRPGAFERVVGRVGLLVVALLSGAGLWQWHARAVPRAAVPDPTEPLAAASRSAAGAAIVDESGFRERVVGRPLVLVGTVTIGRACGTVAHVADAGLHVVGDGEHPFEETWRFERR